MNAFGQQAAGTEPLNELTNVILALQLVLRHSTHVHSPMMTTCLDGECCG